MGKMFEVTVEGIYESDVGSGQQKYKEFKYTFTTSRQDKKGLETHVMRRFIPYRINNDKNKASVPFSRIKTFVVTEIKEINSDECIIKKEINTFDEWQIQDFAATFDLYKVPLAGSCTLIEAREKAILAYMEKVLGVKMKTAEDKAKIRYLKKQADGTYKFDLQGEKILALMPEGYSNKISKKEEPKKGIADFIKDAGLAVANGVLAATGNETVQGENEGEDGSDGSFDDDLLNGLNLNL